MTKYVHPFPKTEYQQRIVKVRAELARRDLNMLLVSSPDNIYYLSGYGTKGVFAFQMLAVPAQGDLVFVTRLREAPNVEMALADSPIREYTTYGDTESPSQTVVDLLKRCHLAKGRIGVEKHNWFLTVNRFEEIVAGLPDATFHDATSVVEDLRLIKSPAELAHMRKAAAISGKGAEAGIAAVQEGATDNEVAIAIISALLKNGGEYMATWPNVSASWRTGLAHTAWNNYTIQRGDNVKMEFSGVVHRYHAPVQRSVFIGDPGPEVHRKTEALRRANTAGIDALRPGVTVGEIDRIQRDVIEGAGYAQYLRTGDRTGYSVGIGFPPTWAQTFGLDIVPGDDTKLQPGMVFHMLLIMYEPVKWGFGVSHTVAITDDGHEVLTPGDKGPFFKD